MEEWKKAKADYYASIQNLSREERDAALKAWLAANPKPQEEVVEEVKSNDVGTQDASPTSTPDPASESSISLDGLSPYQKSLAQNYLARRDYDENIKKVDFLIEDLNKTGDFSKIYAFNEENPGYVNIESIQEFEKKYKDHQAKVKKEREKFTTVVDFGEVYSPGDGYDYKFDVNDTNQIQYYKKSRTQEDFVLVDPNSDNDEDRLVALTVVDKLGHLSGDIKEQLDAILKANKIRSERLKKETQQLSRYLDEQSNTIPLTQVQEVGGQYVSSLSENDFKAFNNYLEKNKKAKLTGFDPNAYLEGNIISYDFEYPDVEEYFDTLNLSEEEKKDRLEMFQIQQEVEKNRKKQAYTRDESASGISSGTGFIPASDKPLDKFKKTKKYKRLLELNEKYKGSADTKDVLEPTPEAKALFISKINDEYAADFLDDKDDSTIFKNVFSDTVKNDPFIGAQLIQLKIAARPLLKQKRQELQEKYDTSTQEGYDNANKEYEAYSKELIQDKLEADPKYQQRYRNLMFVAASAQKDVLRTKQRENDPFFITLDYLQKTEERLFKGDLAFGSVEQLLKTFKSNQKAFNAIQLDMASSDLDETMSKRQALMRAIEEGEIDEDAIYSIRRRYAARDASKASGLGKSLTIKDIISRYDKEIKQDLKEVAEQLDDISQIEKSLKGYKDIDQDDPWLVKTTQQFAASLPYMAAALGGTAVTYFSGGTAAPFIATGMNVLGSAYMGLDFYGQQWYDTFMQGVENQAETEGLSLEDMPEDKRKAYLVNALESGRYDDSAGAAAASTLMTFTERFGLQKQFSAFGKALGLGKDGVASLIKGQWKQAGKSFLRGGLNKSGAYLSEFGTEFSQTTIGDLQKGLSLGLGGEYVNWKNSWEAGTIGGNVALLMPGVAGIASQSAVEIRNTARKLAINFNMGDFSTSSKAVDNWFKMANQKLDKEYNNGKNPEYTKQQYEADKNAINTTYNSRLKIPNNATPEVRAQLLDLMSQKNALEMEINKIDDKDLAAPQILQLGVVKGQIQSLVKQEANIKTLTTSKARQAATKVAAQLGYKYENFQTQDAINKRVEELVEQGAKPGKATDYGQAVDLVDGSTLVLMNDRAAAQDNVFTTDQHEILHPFLKQTFKNNPEAAIAFGKSLMQEIISNPDITINEKFKKDFKEYLDDENYTAANTWEEVIPLVSEALTNGDIKVKGNLTTVLAKIKEFIQNFFGKAKQPLKIRFDEGSDVFAFLRDYNKTIAKGEGLTQAQLDVAEQGAEGALVTDAAAIAAAETGVAEVDAAQQILAEQDANRVEEQPLKAAAKKRIYQQVEDMKNDLVDPETKAATAFLIADMLAVNAETGSTQGTEVDRRLNINVDPQVKEQIILDFARDTNRGLVGLLKEYDPAINDSIMGYLNSKQRGRSLLDLRLQEFYENVPEYGNITQSMTDDNVRRKVESTTEEGSDPKPKPEKEVATTQVDPREFGPVTEGNKLKDVESIVKVNDKDRLTFKKLASKYFDKVSQALFGMPGKKVRGNVSLKYADVKGQPSSSEASKLQNIFKNVEDVRNFIKAMPPYNVATSQTVIDRQGKKVDVSKDVRGRSIAINPTVLKKFYQPVTRAIEGISNKSGRSLGSTSQTQVYELKPEYRGRITKQTIESLQKSLGITKGELSVPIKGAARTEFGSLLTGLSKMYVDNLINTVGRSKLTTDQAKADTGAGKSNALAKKRKAENVFQAAMSGTDALGFNRFNYDYGDVISQLIKGEKVVVKDKDGKDVKVDVKSFDMKTPEGRKKFLDYAVSSGITKRVPRELWPALAFTSENLLKDTTKKYGEQVKETRRLLESLQEDPSDTVFEIEGAVIGKKGLPRGYSGNLPFVNTIEARQWITDSIDAEYNKLKAEGLTDSEARKQANALFPKKGSSEFGNLFTKTDVFTNKNNLETQLDDQAFVESQDAKINELKKFFKLLQDEVMRDANGNLNFEGVAFVGTMLSSSSAGTSHFLRNAAPMRFYQAGYRQAGSANVTIEHTMPATLVGKYLFMAAVEGNVDTKFETIKNNYVQGPLLKVDDNKLKSSKKNKTKGFPLNPFNYIEQMPDFWQDTDSVWGRYFNVNVIRNGGGINPATIMFGKGDSALSRFNIMADGTVINNATKKGLPAVENQNNSSLPNALASKRKLSTQQQISQQGTLDNALSMGRRTAPPIKKIRIFDFDDTLARSKSMVIVNMPFLDAKNEMVDVVARRMFKDEFKNLPSYKQTFKSLNADQQRQVLQSIPGKTIKINATEFAQQAADLEAIGATFDFTEFSKVVEGQKGPLFDVAKKIADARGTEDLFILTARPQEAAGPIREFMKALGIDIPLKNITGLADGTAQAKAMWVADKAAQGYNDFYFADDAIKNVKAVKEVLGQIDVKSKVQQAKASKRRTFDNIVNNMIEDSSGIESFKKFSSAKARTVGENKGRFDWLTMASSAEDFKGLLYSLLGKGKKGEAQYEFLKTNLMDTYNRAEDAITQAKIAAANDFMALKSQFPGLPKTLETQTDVGNFNYQHALRVYIWTQQGMSIPGLSKRDATQLNKFIESNPDLKKFADGLMGIQKGQPYPKPDKNWLGGNLTTDIIGGINKVNRKEYLQEWQENVDIIFSPENLNKMEAAYGTRWRRALENTLKRMKAGTNRLGYNDQTSAVLDWVNNSVGAVMFLNTRSALLQTISAVNFINWGDNNIIKAGAAFANQKQFWSDFMKLMNSDYLVQRRNGLKINVSESEIADAVKDSKNKVKAAIAFLLSKGFVLTRYADSFAIASGGATFYRNRIKKYLKEGMDQKLAEEKAFQDFRQIAEESQQSSSPDKISMQQASAAGRVILNWANTPMQYVRIQKRAIQDLIAGRGDAKVHMSRIAYYGAIQNVIFNALQQALFAIAFDDEEDDEKKKKNKDKKIARVANGMIDSQLKGLGIAGAGMVAVKNTLMKIYEESGKKRPEYEKAALEALSFSPAISSKYRKIVGGLKSFSWNAKEMKEKGFSLDNPAYLAGAQIITAVTNIPIDRVIKKANNIRGILSEQSKMWQKAILFGGWSTWDVGLPYYGGWDKPVEPTPAEIKRQEFDTMKKDTKTQEQIDMLLDLGLTKKEIKALGKEDNRVKKIIELQNKAKEKPTEVKTESTPETKPKPKPKPKTETAEQKLRRQFDSIKSENKPDQVKTLTGFGLTKKEIRDLRYEKDRVEKILELMDK